MATRLDNPAARLHLILQALSDLPSDTPVPKALAKVLTPDEASHSDLARRIGLLLLMPDQIVNEVRVVEEVMSREILLRWYEPVTSVLNSILFLTGAVNQVTGRYGEGDLVALQMCSDMLHRYRREALLSDADLKRITELINDLRNVISSEDDINPELRDVLLSHIHAMEQAINEIPLRGTVGLQQAVAQTYGTLALRPDLVAKQSDNTALWQKFTAVISAITAALSFGTATVQAIETSTAPPPASIIMVENPPASIDPGIHLSINGPESQPKNEYSSRVDLTK